MKCTLGTKFLLWKTDLFAVFSERKLEIALYSLPCLIGITFGIYVGINVGKQDQPFGVIAELSRLIYSPLSYIGSEWLRFIVFAFITALAFFLPCYPLFPAISLFLFCKHFGEYACVSFLSDTLPAAILTLFIIVLPLAFLGAALMIRMALYMRDFRICNGGFPCTSHLKRAGVVLLCSTLFYLALLFVIHIAICGGLYLLLYAI